jgi:hypothetical protein
LIYVQLTTGKFWLLKVYTIKFADLIGAINCSINEAVDGCLHAHARSAGVCP